MMEVWFVVKMKKIFIFLISLFLIVSFASAQGSIGNVLRGTSINVTQICSNCTYVNLTSVVYPNNTYAFLGQYSMTMNGENFYYVWNDTNTIGEYFYTTCGDLNGVNTCQSVNFEVTESNRVLSTSSAILYASFFAILFFLFFLNMWFINKLPSQNTKDEEGKLISISYLKYLRGGLWFLEYIFFVVIFFVASNLAFTYLNEQLFANVLFVIYRIAFVLAPAIVIIWIGWTFAKIAQDKRFWKMLQRGIFPGRKL